MSDLSVVLAAIGAVLASVGFVWLVMEAAVALLDWWRDEDERTIAAHEARRAVLREASKR